MFFVFRSIFFDFIDFLLSFLIFVSTIIISKVCEIINFELKQKVRVKILICGFAFARLESVRMIRESTLLEWILVSVIRIQNKNIGNHYL